jgi:hypothetical protein
MVRGLPLLNCYRNNRGDNRGKIQGKNKNHPCARHSSRKFNALTDSFFLEQGHFRSERLSGFFRRVR